MKVVNSQLCSHSGCSVGVRSNGAASNLLAQFARCTAARFSGDHSTVSRFGRKIYEQARGGVATQYLVGLHLNLFCEYENFSDLEILSACHQVTMPSYDQ